MSTNTCRECVKFSAIKILLTLLLTESGFCNFEVTDSNRGEYDWPETVAGRAVSLPCTFSGLNGPEAVATRVCNESMRQWEIPILNECFTEVTSDIQRIGEVNLSQFLNIGS